MAKSPFTKDTYKKNANIYKILANAKRLEILNIIKSAEVSVEEIVEATGLRKANVSQHLAILRHNKLVNVRRNGQRIYYSILDPGIIEPCRILRDLRNQKRI